jgi:hypothetical protein
MKYTLAVFFFVFSAVAADAQTAMPKGEPLSVTPALIQQGPVTVTSVIQESTPCQRCANIGHTFPADHLYRWAITDWEQSPGHHYDTDRLTWWFIPRPRALVQAICP